MCYLAVVSSYLGVVFVQAIRVGDQATPTILALMQTLRTVLEKRYVSIRPVGI